MISQLLAPLMDPLIGNAQLTGDLGNLLPAGLSEPYRLAITILRVCHLDFLHDPCPLSGIVYPKISLLHKSGESPQSYKFFVRIV